MKKYAIVAGVVIVFGVAVWLMYVNPFSTSPRAVTPQLAKELHLFIWSNYLDPTVKTDFEKEFGVKVIEDNFASNEDLLAKLQAGGSGYDVIVPSDYMVQIMRKQNLLAPLDLKNIANFKNINQSFKNLDFDPGNQFSMPYMWGTTGIGYNKKKASAPPTSWADLFDPAKLEPYKGRISMLDDAREAIGAALIYLGFSPNTTNEKELEAAKQVLIKQKPFVAKYDSESFRDSLAANEVILAHGWTGDIAAAKVANPDIEFVIPKEGSLTFLDNLAIPKTSKNQYTAEVFINYLLRPEISAKIVNLRRYASPNDAAKSLIQPEILNSATYSRPEGIKLYWLQDLGPAGDLYEKIWTEIKGQ
ncbi:spermidine/putrescine ABC transporter substrate-binding protein [Candidatus Acetothermia bacterium]|nr:spermidine/putrescine ABC transporter substrate-binding protein [Candidatus Acetothermia bacterium]